MPQACNTRTRTMQTRTMHTRTMQTRKMQTCTMHTRTIGDAHTHYICRLHTRKRPRTTRCRARYVCHSSPRTTRCTLHAAQHAARCTLHAARCTTRNTLHTAARRMLHAARCTRCDGAGGARFTSRQHQLRTEIIETHENTARILARLQAAMCEHTRTSRPPGSSPTTLPTNNKAAFNTATIAPERDTAEQSPYCKKSPSNRLARAENGSSHIGSIA
jgi:hypothetical protein